MKRLAVIALNLVAAAVALYDGKLLVWDIAVADWRAGSSGVLTLAATVAVTLAFVALPLFGLSSARGHENRSLVIGLISLAVGAGGAAIFLEATLHR